MAKLVSIERCISKKRNIGHTVRSLDALIIGHLASMQISDGAEGFIARLEAMRQKHLTAFLTRLIGKDAAGKLGSAQLAILGVKTRCQTV